MGACCGCQANELERLTVWYDPLGQNDLVLPDEDKITVHRKPLSDKQWFHRLQLTWEISPSLTVYLPKRYILPERSCQVFAFSAETACLTCEFTQSHTLQFLNGSSLFRHQSKADSFLQVSLGHVVTRGDTLRAQRS